MPGSDAHTSVGPRSVGRCCSSRWLRRVSGRRRPRLHRRSIRRTPGSPPRDRSAAATPKRVRGRKVRGKARTPTGSTGRRRGAHGSGPCGADGRLARRDAVRSRERLGARDGGRPLRPVRVRPDDPVLRQGPLPCASCDIPAMAFRASSDGGRTFGPVRYLRRTSRAGSSTRSSRPTAPATCWRAGWTGSRGSCSRSRPITAGRGRPRGSCRTEPAGATIRGSASVRTACTSTSASTTRRAGWRSRTTAARRGGRAAGQHRGPLLLRERHGGDGRRRRRDLDRELRLPYSTVGAPRRSRSRSSGRPTAVRRSTTVVDTVEQPRDCVSDGCPFDHYGGHAVMALVRRHARARVRRRGPAGGDQYLWTRRSADFGRDVVVAPDSPRRRPEWWR